MTQLTLTESMAREYGLDRQLFINTLKSTVIKNATNEQLAAFLVVANKYKLNPLTKEIYAFPDKSGGVMPIVSIDGWLNIINSNPQFNGMEFKDIYDDGHNLTAIECRIYRKDRDHPISVTEYMAECKGNGEVWRRWPSRMLRHKATIQCARYAFGFSGIYDEDEVNRMNPAPVINEHPNNALDNLNNLSELPQTITDQETGEIIQPTPIRDEKELKLLEEVKNLIAIKGLEKSYEKELANDFEGYDINKLKRAKEELAVK